MSVLNGQYQEVCNPMFFHEDTRLIIQSGFGQPKCYNSETCLFTNDGFNFYEGCGQTSVAYNWITTCWDYPQVGIAPASEIYWYDNP
jgi:hypothetical protein